MDPTTEPRQTVDPNDDRSVEVESPTWSILLWCRKDGVFVEVFMVPDEGPAVYVWEAKRAVLGLNGSLTDKKW